jgi:hypothetical protein
VLGIGLASLFSDWSQEIATTVMPAFLATQKLTPESGRLRSSKGSAHGRICGLLRGDRNDRVRFEVGTQI